jgi:hypothetical protein
MQARTHSIAEQLRSKIRWCFMNRDNSEAMQEQEELMQAIADDIAVVVIKSSTPLGATLLAFNQVAAQHGVDARAPQEWCELELPLALLARKRAWEYAAKTRSEKKFAEEMRSISKLFTVPVPEHPAYKDRLLARFEAEQNCRVKYGIQ